MKVAGSLFDRSSSPRAPSVAVLSASVLWQQVVCSSSLFRGGAASSDDVWRGVHSLALALGSVRLVWRGLTLLDFRLSICSHVHY